MLIEDVYLLLKYTLKEKMILKMVLNPPKRLQAPTNTKCTAVVTVFVCNAINPSSHGPKDPPFT